MKKQSKSTAVSGRAHGVRGSNQSGLRAHNERLVLTLVRQHGPLAKADIARRTGLSAQAVSVIMRGLEAEELLEKREPVRGRVGQPSVPMALAPGGAYFLGMKVGRRSLDLILIDFIGTVVGRVHKTHLYPTPDGAVQFANDSISRLLADLPARARNRVAGLGIAIPFFLWDWAGPLGVKPEEMASWRDRDIATEIGRAWTFPVYLQNDATSACGAELVFGTAERPPDFLHIFIGFFVGGGVVLNNNLYSGRSGSAGALGPIPVGERDGRTVQLLDVASLVALERAVNAAGGNPGMIWESAKVWTVPEDCIEAWTEEAAAGLARAIATACCVIDFSCAVIDGWLPDAVRRDLVIRTRDALTKLDLVGIMPFSVEEGTIGPDARSLGAASRPLSERFLLDRTAFLKM
jgi:predicted NBD/HSP70 family sugar kinase